MDLKQLQYFVACAQTGSFSDAAKILYSTQPSVSKVIKALEDTLGMQLFERLPRGIRLTVQGQKVYSYACRITSEIDVLENMASRGMTKWIRISMNPSSWLANQFVDFYNETYEKNYHFQLTTAGVRSVMERVRDYMDDIGFVYILSQHRGNFLHELAKNKIEFVPMYETDVILYPGRKTEFYGSGKDRIELDELEGTRFIQNYQDEFFDIGAAGDEGAISSKSTSVFSAPTRPSSSCEILMMSPTSVISLALSLYMFSAKCLTSSGFAMPFIIISANPEIDVNGVFNSCETFAVNSRRNCSPFSRSVTSRTTITAPTIFSPLTTGFAKTL